MNLAFKHVVVELSSLKSNMPICVAGLVEFAEQFNWSGIFDGTVWLDSGFWATARKNKAVKPIDTGISFNLKLNSGQLSVMMNINCQVSSDKLQIYE